MFSGSLIVVVEFNSELAVNINMKALMIDEYVMPRIPEL
jgi:hypothetical protein